ncbi:UPF0481 protein [Nymphaea thermarum]|nr:UPF0481 protein [Nymphaea thermarum]
MATMRHINTTAMAEERKKKKEIWAIWEASIEKEYESYDPSTYESKLQKKCIYQWPNDLTLTSSMSIHRTPYMVSLGPYHHGEKNLQPMEHHKQRALYRILYRSRVSLYSFIESLEGIEQERRDSYDNLDPNLSSDSFIRMMLLDGCFILELLCSSYLNENCSDNYEPIFSREGKLRSTVAFQDMLLLENQIPLLVLRKLVEVGKLNSINSDAYLNQLISSFYRPTPEYRFASVPSFRERGILRSDEVTSYIVFMDSLIDTAEDVSLLCSRGIAKNHLDSDEDAADVFNKLGDGITYTPDEERYKDLQSYVASDWNVARAYLKRNYFQNPWSILSLLAAIALLILTFIQTLFSVLAVTKGK